MNPEPRTIHQYRRLPFRFVVSRYVSGDGMLKSKWRLWRCQP